MVMKEWNEFWATYKYLDEIAKIRGSVNTNLDHLDLIEKIFDQTLQKLVEDGTRLIEVKKQEK